VASERHSSNSGKETERFPLLSPTKRPPGNDRIARGLGRLRRASKQKQNLEMQNYGKLVLSLKSIRQTPHRFRLNSRRRAGIVCITELRAQVVVVPNAQATNDGNSSTTAPSGGPTSVREMQIFDASQFTNAPSGPSFLTQFAYRPDMIPGASGPRSVNMRIYASTTTRSVAGLSMTFADNLGGAGWGQHTRF
jgi:hypothetical protein